MNILKKLLLVSTLLFTFAIVSLELFYLYQIGQIEPSRILSKNSYSQTAHELLWIDQGEEGEIELDKFSATELAYAIIKASISPSSNNYTSLLPKGSTTASRIARIQLFNATSSQGDWHLKNLVLSIWVSKNYSENEALNYLLDSMWFGNQINGLSDASRFYYNKNANLLSTSEIISLLTMAYAPHRYNPNINPNKHKARATKTVQKLKANWPIKYEKYFYKFPTFSINKANR